jgi:small GTP-binding protein
MPINVNDPEYTKAEVWFHEAKDVEEQLLALNKMISHAPSHKGAENLRQQLTTRRKKLELALEKKKKSGKSSKVGIRKDEMQAVIVGKTNSGKSSLLNVLTNASPKVSLHKFTTNNPIIGMMSYATTSVQLIEIPATDSEFYDKGIVYTADTVILVGTTLEDIKELLEITRTQGKIILVINKSDLLNQNEIRKLNATLKSKYKKYEFSIISTKNKENLEELKDKLFQSFGKLRVYTKEPGKDPDKNRPMIMVPGDTVKDCAEKILKGFSTRIKQIKIWGPSSKFPGQIVGMKHQIKDMDIVEFKTK